MKRLLHMRPFAVKWLGTVLLFLIALAPARSEPSPEQKAKWARDAAASRTQDAAAFAKLIEGIDSLEVFILKPEAREDETFRQSASEDRLDGWKITERLQTKNRQEIGWLAAGLKLSIETAPEGSTPCFEPRHALRFVKEGRPVVVLVCFECMAMRIHGYPSLDEVVISHAATKDFYRLFRAHGRTISNRLAGMSDQEVAKRLVGKWRHKSRRTEPAVEKLEVVFDGTTVFSADGSYHSETAIGFAKNGGEPQPFKKTSEKGQWRVQDGMLITSDPDLENAASSAPVDSWSPLMEVTSDRFFTGSLMPNSDTEQLNERLPDKAR